MSVVEETEESVGTVRPRCTTKVSPSLPPPPCPPAWSEPGVAAAAVRGSPAGVEEGNFSAKEGKRFGYKMAKGQYQKSNCETVTGWRDMMQVAKSIRITGSGAVLWLSANHLHRDLHLNLDLKLELKYHIFPKSWLAYDWFILVLTYQELNDAVQQGCKNNAQLRV